MGDLGKIGIYDAEGGLSTELKFGIGAMGTGADYANTMTNIGRGYDVSSDPHFAHHTPAVYYHLVSKLRLDTLQTQPTVKVMTTKAQVL